MNGELKSCPEEIVNAALAAWLELPEAERNGERPYILGFNDGWDEAIAAIGEDMGAQAQSGEASIPCQFCGAMPAAVSIKVVYRTARRTGPHDMVRMVCACGAIGKCRADEQSAVVSWNEPWQAFVALTSPATLQVAQPPEVRERVARLIDPSAWGDMGHDDYLRRAAEWFAKGRPEDDCLVRGYRHKAKGLVAPSLAKADAILGLIATSAVDGREALLDAYRVGFNDGDQGDWNPDTFLARALSSGDGDDG